MRTRRHVLGQNFLHHQPTIRKIIDLIRSELAERSDVKTLIEVGPGRLALSKPLYDLLKKKITVRELQLHLIERDRSLESDILNGFIAEECKPDLHFMDAAKQDFLDFLFHLKFTGRTPLFFASNLPYSASSQILARLAEFSCAQPGQLLGAVVMVQKELAQRMMAKPGSSERGAFSIFMQSYFDIKLAFDVGPGAFNPPPKVMSSVLVLKPLEKVLTRELESQKKFEAFCKNLFSHRRKMIRKIISPEKHYLFNSLGINGTERPEVLDLEVLVALFKGGA